MNILHKSVLPEIRDSTNKDVKYMEVTWGWKNTSVKTREVQGQCYQKERMDFLHFPVQAENGDFLQLN